MPHPLFDIFFNGKLAPGADASEARQNLARLFKTGEEEVERLFSGDAVRIKSGVDQETAIRYRTAFLKAGALVDIRPSGDAREEPSPRTPAGPGTDTASDLSLMPPNTGSLEDCAPAVVPTPIRDISGLRLAPAGTDLDESAPPAPLAIDTTALSLAPAGTGTLEECQQRKQTGALPDISGMTLEER